jgi:hypothetical protein
VWRESRPRGVVFVSSGSQALCSSTALALYHVLPAWLPSSALCPPIPCFCQAFASPCAVRFTTVGKNSNAHKHLGTLALDLQRERELDAKRAARRAKRELKCGMAVDDEMEDREPQGPTVAAPAHAAANKIKKFGKVLLGKRKKVGMRKSPPVLKKSLTGGKSGIRKPSSVMRKTLKKLAKKRSMVCTSRMSWLEVYRSTGLSLACPPASPCQGR